MCDYLSTYLRKQASTTTTSYVLGSTPVTIATPDPLRYKIVIRGDGASTMYVFAGRNTSDPAGYIITQYAPMIIINEGDSPYSVIGQWEARVLTGTPTLVVSTWSYTQYSKAVIDEYVRRKLPQ